MEKKANIKAVFYLNGNMNSIIDWQKWDRNGDYFLGKVLETFLYGINSAFDINSGNIADKTGKYKITISIERIEDGGQCNV